MRRQDDYHDPRYHDERRSSLLEPRNDRSSYHSHSRRSRSRSRSRNRNYPIDYHPQQQDYRINEYHHDFARRNQEEDTRDRRYLQRQDDFYNQQRGKENHHIPSNRIMSQESLMTINPPVDKNLEQINDDPRCRGDNNSKVVKRSGGGRNTTSFDPMSTLTRPALRVIVEKNADVLHRQLTHDDVVIVPNFLAEEDDWSLYYKLIEEMRACQSAGERGAEWISWHEGAHLISKNPAGSATYQMIQEKIAKFFNIPNKSVGTRFNWYRDSSDWKPFHHDSAAFNPTRARDQNITVGISLGSTRELSFLHAGSDTTIAFPQTNGMLFSFGRDVNIRWKHGIRAVDPESQQQDGRGRISIILWGKCPDVKEEADSPPMMPYQGDRDHKPGNHHGHSDHRQGQDQVCRDFAKNGACRYGDRCRFQHKS